MQTFFNVTMLAASGEGKTTFLSSMDENIRNDLSSNIGLNLSLNPELAAKLDQNKERLKASLSKGTITCFDGIQSTADASSYPLEISHKDSDPFLVVSFTDIPGNWITDDSEKVISYLKNSSVIVIPVDASAIMNDLTEQKTNAENLFRVLKPGLEQSSEPRLILFIPTKCETYINNEAASARLVNKIKMVYKEIFDHITWTSHVKSAIIPIQTLGNCSLMYHKKVKIDNEEVWKPIFSVTQRNQYNPQAIEYPYMYLLSFILEQHYLNRKKGFMGFFRNLFRELNYLKLTNEKLNSQCKSYSQLKVIS
ncbi:hypothetical protein [Siphonobacter sp. SORGH_AS_0500]|uniref:hypothetical protein n=1 Tax=Siphonobacter sp. SORGH_AS_0500 TaxID=1864824 RepID=UPI000CC2E6BC|nr:hypothetical protein [Siphonobacter sp. SORGH_AS_0500]MDR6196929.1 hypothetical protein [Siphonobacter sp. SORGH_AS_0500]PKK36186.1 hypothetical protein BWI96_12285 [Siphonobacter sp. SORGH_AS_0500]